MSLLFDLDGTITDSKPGIFKSINYALKALGLPAESDEHLIQYVGPPLNTIFSSLMPDADEYRVQKAVELFRERYVEIGWKENTPYAGISEALAKLVESGHQLLVCTGKRTDTAVRIMDHFRLSGYFSSIHGCGLKCPKKELIAELIRDDWCETDSWMIGDRADDIYSGRANGLGTVGVSWGYGSEEELSAASPDKVAEFPDELIRIFPSAPLN